MKEKRYYKRELILLQAKKIQDNKLTFEDDKLFEFCMKEIVFNETDLEELLDSYIFVSENEALGMHGNTYKKSEDVNIPNEEISKIYGDLKDEFGMKIEKQFRRSSIEEQDKFINDILPHKKEFKTRCLKLAEDNAKIFDEADYRTYRIDMFMKLKHITQNESIIEYCRDRKHIEREGIQSRASLDAINELETNLKEKIKVKEYNY